MIVIERPFENSTVLEVACLLLLVYRPHEAGADSLHSISEHLPGVLQLAHQLDVERVVASIADYVVSVDLSIAQLGEWASLAERLHLDTLEAHCVRKAA